MDGWMDGLMDGWVGRCAGGLIGRQAGRQAGRQTDRQTDREIDRYYLQRLLLSMQSCSLLHMLERVLFPQLIKTMSKSSPKINQYIKTNSYILTLVNRPFS